jgi:large repetitive protein
MGHIRHIGPIPNPKPFPLSHTILLVIVAAACALGSEAQVKVRVRNGDTGQWLAGARAQVGDIVYYTNADGECVIPAVAGGRVRLTVSMQGCYSATDSALPTASGTRLVVRLYGTRPRTAMGFVRDGATNKPLPRAIVRVKGDAATARSDSAGMYAISFPPGDRELVAALPGFRGFPRQLSIPGGDTLAVDLPLYDTSLAVGELAGRVEVQGLGVACGANVTVERTRLGAATDENGDYIITGVPAGTHRILFTCAGCRKTARVVDVQAWQSLVLNVQLIQNLPPAKR